MATASAEQQQTWSETQTKPLRALPDAMRIRVMTRLWRRMATLYGESRWLAHAPESLIGEWAEVLGHKTLAELARGLESCERSPGDYPPGATQFRDRCREFQPGTFAGASRPTPPADRLLPWQRAPQNKTARAWMAFMQYEEIVPRTWAMDAIDEALEDWDIDKMREQVRDERCKIENRMGIHREDTQ